MKLSISKMGKSARIIGKRKFCGLSSRKQHQLLSSLANEVLSGWKYNDFLLRYEELHSWINLDRYSPPPWLNEHESIMEYFIFHEFRGGLLEQNEKVSGKTISWEPVYNVNIVLDQIRSPFNVGSILRIIDNFGFNSLTHGTSWLRIDHPQLCKAARGCEKWIPVNYEENLISYLEKSEVPVIGIENDDDSVSIDNWHPPENCFIVLGNESYGISSEIRNLCMEKVKIPMFGFKGSMNVHHALVCAARKIVEYHRKV
ncbi:MAG: hypothetical protein HOD17_09535 [Desulfobacteraceae bacterium]|nr:hypothetical protein [Desulfobacteraceae bacterium]